MLFYVCIYFVTLFLSFNGFSDLGINTISIYDLGRDNHLLLEHDLISPPENMYYIKIDKKKGDINRGYPYYKGEFFNKNLNAFKEINIKLKNKEILPDFMFDTNSKYLFTDPPPNWQIQDYDSLIDAFDNFKYNNGIEFYEFLNMKLETFPLKKNDIIKNKSQRLLINEKKAESFLKYKNVFDPYKSKDIEILDSLKALFECKNSPDNINSKSSSLFFKLYRLDCKIKDPNFLFTDKGYCKLDDTDTEFYEYLDLIITAKKISDYMSKLLLIDNRFDSIPAFTSTYHYNNTSEYENKPELRTIEWELIFKDTNVNNKNHPFFEKNGWFYTKYSFDRFREIGINGLGTLGLPMVAYNNIINELMFKNKLFFLNYKTFELSNKLFGDNYKKNILSKNDKLNLFLSIYSLADEVSVLFSSNGRYPKGRIYLRDLSKRLINIFSTSRLNFLNDEKLVISQLKYFIYNSRDGFLNNMVFKELEAEAFSLLSILNNPDTYMKLPLTRYKKYSKDIRGYSVYNDYESVFRFDYIVYSIIQKKLTELRQFLQKFNNLSVRKSHYLCNYGFMDKKIKLERVY